MRKKLILSFLIGMLFTIIAFVGNVYAVSTSDLLNGYVYPKATEKQGIEPSFSVEKSQTESISPATGSLEIKQTDLILKGKNGLDFSLTRVYNVPQNTTNRLIYNNNGYQTTELDTRCEDSQRWIEVSEGWTWDLPYLENKGSSYVYTYLHYGNAGVWQFKHTPEDGDSNLKDYPMKDMVLDYDYNHLYSNGMPNGLGDSYYVLKEKDGKQTYFDATGRLVCIIDRFGNRISFQFGYITCPVCGSQYVAVLKKVTDSCGREIVFNFLNNQITVTVTDGTNERKIYYNKIKFKDTISDPNLRAEINDETNVLDTFIDAEGRQTKYEYTCNTALMSFNTKNIDYYTNPTQWPFYNGDTIYFANLTKITYPTGAQTRYGYAKCMKNLGVDGSMEFYKVDRRYDYTKDGHVINYKEFSFKYNGTFEYDGYPYFIDEDEQTLYSILRMPDSYQVQTQVTDVDNNTETYSFNYKLLNTDILRQGVNHNTETANEYDMTKKLLTKTINRSYNLQTGQYMEKVENYTYNDYRDTIGYWGVDADRDSNLMPLNDEHKVTSTYSDAYHLLTGKMYKKDASTTIREEYVPAADNKTIQWTKIYENEVLKKQTKNTCDSYGNIIQEDNYLDNWTDYISNKYSYTDNDPSRNGKFNGIYLTRKWVEGVKDADGNLVAAKTGNSPGVVDEVYKYNWFGDLIEKQDGKGNSTTYLYDKLNRVVRTTNPDNTYKTITYRTDTTENSFIATDENNNKTKSIYDEFGNIAYEQIYAKNALGQLEYQNVKQYIYDAKSRLDTEKDLVAGSNTKYYYYSDDRANAKEIKDNGGALLYKESYTYDDANSGGLYWTFTKAIQGDINSPSVTTVAYIDKQGQIIKQERQHDDNGTFKTYTDTFKFDYLGNKTEEKIARAYDEGWAQQWTSKFEYDFESKPVKTYNINGDFSTTEYDALGRVKAVTDIKGNKAATRYSTTYTYDNLGRLLTENIPFEDVGGTIYNSVKKHYYDLNGNITLDKTSNNKPGETVSFNQKGYEYNNLNLLMKITTYNNGQPENYTQYWYDAAGNKVRMYTGLSSPLTINGLDNVTPGSDTVYSVTKYDYNEFNKLKKMTDPLGKEENYTYDLNGNLKQKTDRNGNVTIMAFDSLNRLLTNSVVTPDGKGDATYAYMYTLTGNRLFMSSGGTSTSYTYDDLGRLTVESDANGIAKIYTYDAGNNRKSFVLRQNGSIKTNTAYSYDNMNRLYQVLENGALQATYGYNDNGNRASLAYTNGNSTQYQYSLANKVKVLINLNGSNQISRFDYAYYLDGNQASMSQPLTTESTEYVYDGLGRLQSETEKLNGVVTSSNIYTYDASDNRSSMVITGGAASSTVYDYDLNNRLLTQTKTIGTIQEITRFSYDDNGNQIYTEKEIVTPDDAQQVFGLAISTAGEATSDDTTINVYNGFNQLIKAVVGGTVAEYSYNADGLRTSKYINGVIVNHMWDGQEIALELNSTGTVINKYVRGINLIYSEDGSGANRRFYIFNAHSDVVQLTGGDGSVEKSYSYDSFGNEKNIDPNDNQNFRYAGEYFDRETGTIYLRARYYDPTIGRFITEDSVWGKDTDPLSLNLYTYCTNNPVLLFDPSGHSGETAAVAGSMWWLCAVDGPIPAGDVIYGLAVAGTAVYEYGPTLVQAASTWGPAALDWTENVAAPWISNAANDVKEAGKKAANWVKEQFSGGSSGGDPNDPNKNKLKDIPKQLHHFLSNKSKIYTKQFTDIVSRYKLDLNQSWNKQIMDHLGRHANAYHEYMLEQIRKIDSLAKGNTETFLKLYEAVKQKVMQNPEMLGKNYWNNIP